MTSTEAPKPWGGARVGAGRKPKPLNAATLSLRADHRIGNHLTQLLTTLLDLAIGEFAEETDAVTGETRRVCVREPNAEVCLYLADRILGNREE